MFTLKLQLAKVSRKKTFPGHFQAHAFLFNSPQLLPCNLKNFFLQIKVISSLRRKPDVISNDFAAFFTGPCHF